MINRIVAYGCSFTSGDELCDHIVLENADYFKKALGKDAYMQYFFNNVPSSIRDNLPARQRKASWVGSLAGNLNLEVDNRAIAGSSLLTILWNILRDLESGKITSTDFVIVGTTTLARSIYFDQTSEKSVLHSYPSSWPLHLKDNPTAINNILDFLNPMYMHYNYYVTLSAILRLANTALNNRLVACQCAHKKYISVNEDTPEYYKTVIDTLKTDCTSTDTYIADKGLYDFQFYEVAHGFGHLPKKVHDMFSEYLTPIIFDRIDTYNKNAKK